MLVQEDQYDDDKCEADTEGIVDNVFSVIDAVIKKKINYIVIAEEIISLFQEGKNALKVCRSYESVYEGIAVEYVKHFTVAQPVACQQDLSMIPTFVKSLAFDIKSKNWVAVIEDVLDFGTDVIVTYKECVPVSPQLFAENSVCDSTTPEEVVMVVTKMAEQWEKI